VAKDRLSYENLVAEKNLAFFSAGLRHGVLSETGVAWHWQYRLLVSDNSNCVYYSGVIRANGGSIPAGVKSDAFGLIARHAETWPD